MLTLCRSSGDVIIHMPVTKTNVIKEWQYIEPCIPSNAYTAFKFCDVHADCTSVWRLSHSWMTAFAYILHSSSISCFGCIILDGVETKALLPWAFDFFGSRQYRDIYLPRMLGWRPTHTSVPWHKIKRRLVVQAFMVVVRRRYDQQAAKTIMLSLRGGWTLSDRRRFGKQQWQPSITHLQFQSKPSWLMQ